MVFFYQAPNQDARKTWHPTIHVDVFSSHVYSGGDPIKLAHEPLTNANASRTPDLHTWGLPDRSALDGLRKGAVPAGARWHLSALITSLRPAIKCHWKVSQTSRSWTPEGIGHYGGRAWKPWSITFKTISIVSHRWSGAKDAHANSRLVFLAQFLL